MVLGKLCGRCLLSRYCSLYSSKIARIPCMGISQRYSQNSHIQTHLENTTSIKKAQNVLTNLSPKDFKVSEDKLTLADFIKADSPTTQDSVNGKSGTNFFEDQPQVSVSESLPYLRDDLSGLGRKVYIETYGCQMNVSDTEIAWSILQAGGFTQTRDIAQADVLLMMTCAIRESAEEKIRHRLKYFEGIKKRRSKKDNTTVKIGLLGCMAERLKGKLLEEEKMIDIVCGPDAYRDLPRLLSVAQSGQHGEEEKIIDIVCGPDAYRDLPRLLSVAQSGQHGVNVQLSLEETYADVVPVRLDSNSVTAFVSIMRGCDNMCSYCIVPFTRGQERSRPLTSIVDEVRQLSHQGIREVTLLGQNVNSYRDTTQSSTSPTNLTPGFKTIYKTKVGGARFVDLLDQVSQVDPEMRVRFTSPHPKDFPVELLELIKERPNICNQLHLPAQSGNDDVLEKMRRGYTCEAYMDLVGRVRQIIPDIALSSDFIAGFCGETDDAHQDTLSLMDRVTYNNVFCFPYSMRQKTHAYHRLADDVPQEVKVTRHRELSEAYRRDALVLNQGKVGQQQLILIEGTSKRSTADLYGRNDHNTKVIVPDIPLDGDVRMAPGDYVLTQDEEWITSCSSQVLKGTPLHISSITDFYRGASHQSQRLLSVT